MVTDIHYLKSETKKEWAKIETSVLEFSSELDALNYFQKEFLPFSSDLTKRCIFIENSKGEKVATATAWWEFIGGSRRPWLHWVAVMPEYQRLGLGKCVVAQATKLMVDIEGFADFYLRTQTWSHKAIKIYEKFGYVITDEEILYQKDSDNYSKALEVLNNVESVYSINGVRG